MPSADHPADTTLPTRITQALDLIRSDPAAAYATMRRLSRDSLLDPLAGTLLAQAYAGLSTEHDASPLTRAWALLARAGHPVPKRPGDQVIADARSACGLFKQGGLTAAAAWALEVEAFALAKRRAQGDLDAAGRALSDALTLREQANDAATDHEAAALAAFDLAEGLVYLGWLHTSAGPEQALDALKQFDRGIAVAEGQLQTPAGQAQAFWPTWTLVRHLEGRGRLLVDRDLPGDWPRAEADWRAAIGLRQGLVAAQPASPVAAWELFTVRTRLAGLLARSGSERHFDALALYGDCLGDAQRRLAASPAASEPARDCAFCLNALADLLVAAGSLDDVNRALAHQTEALALRERLLAASPAAADAQRDLRLCYRKLAELAERRVDPAAVDWWRKALAAARAMQQAGTLAADEAWIVALLRRRYWRAWLRAGWRSLAGGRNRQE